MSCTAQEFNDRSCQPPPAKGSNTNTKDENGPTLRSVLEGISVGLDPETWKEKKDSKNSPPFQDESKAHQNQRRFAMRIFLILALFFCSVKMTYLMGFRSLIWRGLGIILMTLTGGQYLWLGQEGEAESFTGSSNTNRVFQTVMHLMFIMWDTLVVSLTWRFNHFKNALENRCWLELFCMLCHYSLIPLIGFVNWMLLAFVGSIYILGNLILSNAHHYPLVEHGERLHCIEQVFYQTTNIRSSWWADWWMGRNLSSQIEHRLFPTMNENNRKLCRDRVKAFAEKHGLPYQECSFEEAVTNAYLNFEHVANDIKHN